MVDFPEPTAPDRRIVLPTAEACHAKSLALTAIAGSARLSA